MPIIPDNKDEEIHEDGTEKLIDYEKPERTITNQSKAEYEDITAFYYLPRDLCMNESKFEDFYMEYGIRITGSL